MNVVVTPRSGSHPLDIMDFKASPYRSTSLECKGTVTVVVSSTAATYYYPCNVNCLNDRNLYAHNHYSHHDIRIHFYITNHGELFKRVALAMNTD